MLGITGLVKGNLTSKRFHIRNLNFVIISREKENCSPGKEEKIKVNMEHKRRQFSFVYFPCRKVFRGRG